ncbi:hypothetical protein N7509_003973 [Penicillium cosmopolitanum]|uniref:Uncharacterized protein n=1 Tax=Penicillium cosmopolitanum TaxID=1131564 RepID=A0A9W9W645_9EURO|nr:uncharacterized protein N7509_003973 [Penicillium cosmopolitanum]KAJ5404102.1 hypothetical protein N7509_003973 [Penicillium cosmopolitanum]
MTRTEDLVDGYRLENMKEYVPVKHRLLALLLACLIMVNNQLTAFSQFLDNSLAHLRRALFRPPPRDHDRDDRHAPKTLDAEMEYRSSSINTATSVADETDARIISPEGLSPSTLTSYVLLFETGNHWASPMHEISNASPASALRVINIPVGLGDDKLFETLRFLHRSKTQTFQEYLRLFFSFSQYRLDLMKASSFQCATKVGVLAIFNLS